MSDYESKRTDEFNRLKSAWRAVLTSAQGVTIVNDLKFTANMDCHVPNDPTTSAFNEGQRIMARDILYMLEDDQEG